MQFGYGVGGSATAIDSIRRRWLVVLLAFLVAMAMVLVAAFPAYGDDDDDDDDGDDDGDGNGGGITLICGGDPDPCESFSVAGEWGATCEGCTGEVIIRDPANPVLDIADVQIKGDAGFELVLTTVGKGPDPAEAFVTVFDSPKFPDGTTLPDCQGKTKTNCVKITRSKKAGGHTKYVVKVDADPRFRFR